MSAFPLWFFGSVDNAYAGTSAEGRRKYDKAEEEQEERLHDNVK
jgi:hypothetical protein